MFWGIEYDFWLLRVWIPGAVSGNCLVTNGLREVWLLCCFDVRWTCLPVLASGGDSGISKGTFALAGVYAASFAALCTMPKVLSWIAQYLCVKNLAYMDFLHWLLRRSGSVPTEITEPTLEARSSRHVFIETLQSKDFLAILLICGNFQITAFRVHSSLEAKNHIENRATSETVWAQFIFWCAKFESLILWLKILVYHCCPPIR